MNPHKLKLRWNYLYISNALTYIVKYLGKYSSISNVAKADYIQIYVFEDTFGGEIGLAAFVVRKQVLPCPEYLRKYIELFSC